MIKTIFTEIQSESYILTDDLNLFFCLFLLQLFQRNTGEYISQDKYIGRALDDEGAMLNLKQYFNDGFSLRSDVIRKMLEKLQYIHKTMAEQHMFHFLSVSLLLIYDSDSEVKVDARLIDFANAISQDDLPLEEQHNGYNEDLLFGISSINNILQGLLSQCSCRPYFIYTRQECICLPRQWFYVYEESASGTLPEARDFYFCKESWVHFPTMAGVICMLSVHGTFSMIFRR